MLGKSNTETISPCGGVVCPAQARPALRLPSVRNQSGHSLHFNLVRALQTPDEVGGRGAPDRAEEQRAPVLTGVLMHQIWTAAAISTATCVELARAK